MTDPSEPLFSYGTLQYAAVQQRQFGRLLTGEADALTGYRLGRVAISDPEVVRQSGEAWHPALTPDVDGGSRVAGMVFWITRDELAAADAYESGEYVRQRTILESGREAWIYVAAPGLKVE
jgi:gamma-glutamylcyclotransferase (GGCT)/AIG2-like uncharacterized protein YtfP